jgi:hypothetical protein
LAIATIRATPGVGGGVGAFFFRAPLGRGFAEAPAAPGDVEEEPEEGLVTAGSS